VTAVAMSFASDANVTDFYKARETILAAEDATFLGGNLILNHQVTPA